MQYRGDGVWELRIHYGPGFRIYFGEEGPTLVILLCGGDKESQIKDMIGKDCSNSGQCEVIAFGSKPCGGPWEYLVYSSSGTDVELLIEKDNTYNQFQNEYNMKNGIGSDCAFVMPPEVSCADGKCQIISN